MSINSLLTNIPVLNALRLWFADGPFPLAPTQTEMEEANDSAGSTITGTSALLFNVPAISLVAGPKISVSATIAGLYTSVSGMSLSLIFATSPDSTTWTPVNANPNVFYLPANTIQPYSATITYADNLSNSATPLYFGIFALQTGASACSSYTTSTMSVIAVSTN